MKALIVYDSMYGNTEQIAQSIGSAIAGDVKVLNVAKANPSELESIDLLVVGAPTQGGRATPTIREFLDKVSKATILNP